MKKAILSFLVILLNNNLYSQDFNIVGPRLDYNGKLLTIAYDINDRKHEKFYVWVEMTKKNGELIKIKSLSGDVGERVESGKNHRILWEPVSDSVFIDEDITVELKVEKYARSYNKGSLLLKTSVFPGWGEKSRGSNKPWWIAGVASYSALAGGIVVHMMYKSTYNSYASELDPNKRTELFKKSQNQNLTSTAFIITSATIWAANSLRVALAKNSYKPLNYFNLSVERLPFTKSMNTLCSLKIDF